MRDYLIVAGLIFGFITGLAAVTGVFGRLGAWLKKKAKTRRERSVRHQLQLLCEGQADIDGKLADLNAAREATKADDAEMHLKIADNLVRSIRHNEEMREKIADNLEKSMRHTETLNSAMMGKLEEINADVRLAVSAVAVSLEGLVQLGKESHVIVNGPVGKMREKLNDRIIEGIGAPRPEKKGA